MSLKFMNAEKHINDSLVFPSFNLSLNLGKVTAIHSSVSVREQLIELLLGQSTLSSGDIQISGHDILKVKREMGFFFLDDCLYERLSIEENITFYKRIYNSTESISEIIKKVQLESKRKVKVKLLTHSEKKACSICMLTHTKSRNIYFRRS